MSMIDDAADQTKDSIKDARERDRAQELGDAPEDSDSESAQGSGGGAGSENRDAPDTSGDVPVDNLE